MKAPGRLRGLRALGPALLPALPSALLLALLPALLLALLPALLLALPSASAAASAVEEAERLAAQAVALAEADPPAALAKARRALALTAEFQPTDFVAAGRKGELVEDAFLAARGGYRRHRGALYRAVGISLARADRQLEAARYLRRALLLDGDPRSAAALARALTATGRADEALACVLENAAAELAPELAAAAADAADAAGIPSLQAELDRARLTALDVRRPVAIRDGPLRLPGRRRLSTGAVVSLEPEGLLAVYVAEPSCRSCSADLLALKRAAPAGVELWLASPGADRDEALRRVAGSYRYDWPYVVGEGLAGLDLPAPGVALFARRGFLVAVAQPPLATTLPGVFETLLRTDVRESIPRPGWNRRPVARRPAPAPPALLPEGLAPGEDEPAPEAFGAALAAYRAGRYREALTAFEAVEAAGDGWLLPPEGRLDKALCLAGLGRREAARDALLAIGDSRFQEAVDRALERVFAPAR